MDKCISVDAGSFVYWNSETSARVDRSARIEKKKQERFKEHKKERKEEISRVSVYVSDQLLQGGEEEEEDLFELMVILSKLRDWMRAINWLIYVTNETVGEIRKGAR